jgi:hypothetical protein
MNFPTFIDTVARSGPGDWNVQTGPLFLAPVYHPDVPAKPTAHLFNMAYWPDLSITMAYGMTCSEDIQHPWASTFPNPKTESHYLDFFYTKRRRDIARLVHQITNPMRDFDEYFAWAKLKAIDEVWPL